MSDDIQIRTKVKDALDEIVADIRADGGDVELIEIVENKVRVKFEGASYSPDLQMTICTGIERYLRNRVPELEEIVVEQKDFDL